MVAGTEAVRYGDQRVADQLPRAVVGDVAAALHPHQFRAHRGRLHPEVAGQVRARAMGEHVRMLQQEEVVLTAVGEDGLLQCQRLAVRHATEPAHAQRAGHPAQSSWVQSRVSRISFTRTRNPAA